MQVVAYLMYEDEEAAASNILRDFQRTDSFLVGEIDEMDLDSLRETGVFVQEIVDTAPEPLDELLARNQNLAVPRAAFERAEGFPLHDTTYFTAQLSGPLIEEWRTTLKKEGVEVLEASGPNRYTVRIAPDASSAIMNLGFAQRLRPYSNNHAEPELCEAV
ncbi:MAG: hypothetical protein ABJF50_17165 [Paracoccaceae bacterium]